MNKRTKLWKSISVISLAGVTGISGCHITGEGEGEGERELTGEGATVHQEVATDLNSFWNVGTEGEGEGGGSTAQVLAIDDLAYLTQLNLIKGHIYIGHALYQAGEIELAKTHMKHPESELYADIEPAFSARNVSGFATELTNLSTAVGQEKSNKEVQKAYNELNMAINKSGDKVNQCNAEPAEKLMQAVELLRAAGEEYAIAVDEGKMVNAHEYQDAYGFTIIAKNIVEDIDTNDAKAIEAKQNATKILDNLMNHWPSLVPPPVLETEEGEIYGAASHIELLTVALK